MIYNSKEIRTRYLKGAFVIDFVSFLPIDLVYIFVDVISIFLRILLKIPKFLHIIRVFVYLASFRNSKNLNICKLFFIYYLITHYFSCAIFYSTKLASYGYILSADNIQAVLSNSKFNVDYAAFTLKAIYALCRNDIGPIDFSQRVLLTVIFYVGTI